MEAYACIGSSISEEGPLIPPVRHAELDSEVLRRLDVKGSNMLYIPDNDHARSSLRKSLHYLDPKVEKLLPSP